MNNSIDYVQMSRDGIEVFLDIPGYEGLYQVSNLGRVKSLYFNRLFSENNVNNVGYKQANLRKNSKQKNFSVHKLVAITFLFHIPDGTNKIVVNHKDQNKLNNNLYNLELISNRQNIVYSLLKKTPNKKIGISFHKKTNKWRSSIIINKKNYHLGKFNDQNEASDRYDEALFNFENGKFESYYKSLNLTNNKKVNKFDLYGNFISAYDSMTEAALENNTYKQHISDYCKGKRKSAGGFRCSYAD